MNNYFSNSVKNLNIKENRYLLSETEINLDPIEIIIDKYKVHPSILNIKDKIKTSNFRFTEVPLNEIELHLKHLNPKEIYHPCCVTFHPCI